MLLVNAVLGDCLPEAVSFEKSAIDAFEQVDVIACRSPQAIGARIRINRDSERRADRFTKLAGDTALLAVRVAPQGMQTSKAGRLWRFLFGILYRDLLGKKIAQGHTKPLQELPHKKRLQQSA